MTKEELKKKIKVKTYPYLTIFNSTRCNLKVSKLKEKRLYQIIKEIKILSAEMENLF